MKRKLVIFTLVLALISGTLLGCTKTDTTGGGTSDKLVVYSPNSEDIINLIIPMFEKETGISVELISAGTGELLKRIESEKDNPYADVMFGGSHSQFAQHPELFEEYVSPNDKYLVENARNKSGYMTSYIADGSCLLINTDIVGDIKIEGYADLLNPALKGKIATADPASSSSAFAQLTNMLLAMGGDYTSDAGWDYVKTLVENLDGKVASGSGAAHRSVANGEYIVALTYEDPSAAYVRDGAPVKVIYPVEGAVFLNATSGIVKDAKNLENAKKFIDFIISKEAQDAFGTQLTTRPLREDAKLGDHMTPFEDMYLLEEDVEYVNAHKPEIVEKYIEIFTSVQ